MRVKKPYTMRKVTFKYRYPMLKSETFIEQRNKDIFHLLYTKQRNKHFVESKNSYELP